jgi:hypothetical protein
LPTLPAGTYTFAVHLLERGGWGGRNTRTEVYPRAGILTADGTDRLFDGNATIGSGGGNTQTGTFTLTEESTPILRFTRGSRGGDPCIAWIQVSNPALGQNDVLVEVVDPIEDQAMFADTSAAIESALPATMQAKNMAGETVTCGVEWQVPVTIRAYETITVTGVLTSPENANRTITTSFKAEIVPRGLVYFIDSNAMDQPGANYPAKPVGSWSYDLVKELVPDLLNETADKAKGAEDSWGYTKPVGADNGGMGSLVKDNWLRALNPNDKFDYGWFSYSENDGTPTDITYDLELPAGTYKVTMGTAEYWTGVKNRPYVFSVRDGNTVLARTLNLLESTESVQGRNTEELEITLTKATTVTVSVKFDSENELNLSGFTVEEPQLSWLGV